MSRPNNTSMHSSPPEAFPPDAPPADALATDAGDSTASRRTFLLLGMSMLLAGCGGPQKVTSTQMPGPLWRPRSEPISPAPLPEYRPAPVPPAAAPASMTGILPRAQWTSARAVPTRMNRMTAINFITVHHDGMTPFYDEDERNTINRLESIRRFHRDRLNWGDIGYHFAIDRAGRVWEGRSLGYQGAHVGNHNEGNIGVLVLGNFDQQTPSDRQLRALNAQLSSLMRAHRVPVGRVATHREWETANTVCPGANLQSHMDSARRRGWIG